MDLLEYQGKQFFASYGIPVSDGEACQDVDTAVAVANRVGYPVVVKAQVHTGGRGKAGGVKLAANEDEAREHASNILGLDIKGHIVKTIWVEVASDIAEEYYASFTLDRSAKLHLGMLSAEGGVEIGDRREDRLVREVVSDVNRMCVGETEKTREAGRAVAHVKKQLCWGV